MTPPLAVLCLLAALGAAVVLGSAREIVGVLVAVVEGWR